MNREPRSKHQSESQMFKLAAVNKIDKYWKMIGWCKRNEMNTSKTLSVHRMNVLNLGFAHSLFSSSFITLLVTFKYKMKSFVDCCFCWHILERKRNTDKRIKCSSRFCVASWPSNNNNEDDDAATMKPEIFNVNYRATHECSNNQHKNGFTFLHIYPLSKSECMCNIAMPNRVDEALKCWSLLYDKWWQLYMLCLSHVDIDI